MLNIAEAPDYPRTNQFALGLFCAYVLIWFLQAGHRVSILGAVRIEFIVGLVLVVLSLSALLTVRTPRERSAGLGGVIMLFFLFTILQVPFSADFDMSVAVFWDRLVKFSCMALFIAAFVKSPRDARWFLAAFLLACFYITQESFRGAVTGRMIWQNQGIMRLHGDTPLFHHPNSLGGLAVGVVPFVYHLFPVVKKKWQKLFLLGLLGTGLACVMYSGSRTAYVGLLSFLLAAFLGSRRKLKLAAAGLLIALAGWPILPSDYQRRFETIFTQEEIEGGSMHTRRQILEDAWTIFTENPLGVGVAAFPAVRKVQFGRTQDTHNLYLEAATNLGVQGFAVFLLLLFLVGRSLRRSRRSAEKQLALLAALPPAAVEADRGLRAAHAEDLKLLRAAGAAMAGYLFMRVVVGFFGSDLYEIYWWLTAGFAVALHGIVWRAEEKTNYLVDLQKMRESPLEVAV